MKTLKEYIELFEDDLSSVESVGVSEPEASVDSHQTVEVEVDYSQDFEGNPTKTVWARAGGEYAQGTDADTLRQILIGAGVPMPDKNFDTVNDTGISVSVANDGRISANADGENADKFLAILTKAGIKTPLEDDKDEQVAEATDAEVTEVVRLAKEIRK